MSRSFTLPQYLHVKGTIYWHLIRLLGYFLPHFVCFSVDTRMFLSSSNALKEKLEDPSNQHERNSYLNSCDKKYIL